jgi:UDP-galactopyranose mutase
MMKIIVVGAGFTGACAALTLHESLDCEITILEQSAKPGGMLRTLHTRDGLPYEYGPRVVSVFRGTPDIIPFLERFVGLEERQVYQGTRLLPDYPVIPFPVDLESVRALRCGQQIEREMTAIREARTPPREANLREYLESSVGPTLTELAFEGFNRKFWGRRLENMPATWGKLRHLERLSEKGQFRLPSRSPHYYPSGGFNPLFERMLAGVDLRTCMRVAGVKPDGHGVKVFTDAGAILADLMIATAPIDALLEYRFGPLEWRGYRIEADVVEGGAGPGLGRAPDGVPFAWLYTPWPETPVCRTTDFGVIHQGSDRCGPAVILREIVDDTVPMYPVWWEDHRFYKYLEEAARIPGMVPLGRLGLYKYVTMDSTLAMVQRLAESLESYLEGDTGQRFEILRAIRGDWQN